MRELDFRFRTLEDFYELWRNSTELRALGVTSYFGKMAQNQPCALPYARWVPTADTYTRGGFPKAVDTILPLRPGEPARDVVASAIWTRAAGVEIYLYPSTTTNLQTLIDASLLALEAIFGVRPNYDVLSGRNVSKDDYQTESDGYALSVSISIPTFKLQPRHTAGSSEISIEAEVSQ